MITWAFLLALLALGLWVREVSKSLAILEKNTLKALDVIDDRMIQERAATEASLAAVVSTDTFRLLRRATEDEDWTRAAIVRLRQEGKFEAAQNMEEMEHQIAGGVDAHVFRNLFRGIGWVPE